MRRFRTSARSSGAESESAGGRTRITTATPGTSLGRKSVSTPRTWRLRRFRTTARLSNFRPTTTVARKGRPGLARAWRRRFRDVEVVPRRVTARISRSVRRRCCRGSMLHRQSATAFGTPSAHNVTPTWGAHSCKETMHTGTASFFWLIGSLRHSKVALNPSRRSGAGQRSTRSPHTLHTFSTFFD